MRTLSSLLGFAVGELAAVILLSTVHIVPRVNAISFTPAPSPNLDLSQLGRVALAGDFDSISLYTYEGQGESSFSTNGSQSLLTRYPNGAFASLASADAYIETMCPFVQMNGKLAGIVVGGNFTSLGGQAAQGIALFDPNSTTITPLPGLSGRVSSVYCDHTSGTVYVGGSFSGGNSTNAIAWITGWTNLPFAGFNGPVTSITKAPSGNIIFAGSFDGLGNTTTPVNRDMQVINVASGIITSGSSSLTAGFSDPRNIICKTAAQDGPGNSWLLADATPGYWQAKFQFGFRPTKLRLYNTLEANRGTKTFRVTALLINGIMNFTTGGADGRTVACDAFCTLPENNSTYQDFHFVNPIGMNGLRIDILDWYGNGGGLSGIELFQDDIYSFAITEFNEPQCDDVSRGANSTATGPWTVTPSGNSSSEYLTATLTGPNLSFASAQVVFQPDIKQSGNYSVTVYTPGCVQDNSCPTRGRVNITGIMGSGTRTANQPVTTELFQTNYYDKYDQVYFGYIDANSESFRPTVTLSPSIGQTGPLTVVAQRVRFELIASTGGLNGLFEYNPNLAIVDTDFSKSAIDTAGMSLQAGALINSLAVHDKNLYVAGNFSTGSFSNIFSIADQNATTLPGGGLNSEVLSMFQNGSMLYVGGNFTNTRDNNSQGLKGVAVYSVSDSAWQPLGAGVDGVVFNIVPLTLNVTANQPELVITVNGNFNTVNAFGSNASFSVNNFAVWVPSRKNWLHNLNTNSISIGGQLVTQTDVPGYDPLFAGSISSQALGASDAVALSGSGQPSLQSLGVNITATQASMSPVAKRAISGQNVTGAVTGLFYDSNGLNITVLGGHFTATSSNGSNINNLLFINNTASQQVTGVGNGLNADSAFLALATQGSTLFAGGTIAGTVNGNSVNGLILYDLARGNYVANQPPALTGTSVAVNAIAPQSGTSNVFVAGNFASAGAFSCPSVCVYDTTRSQWNSPGSGIGGSVAALTWQSSTHLIIGGNLTVNGVSTTMATYDTKAQTFTEFAGAGGVPGPVTALTAANTEYSQFWVAGKSTNGSAFLEKYDGARWLSVGNTLGSATTIRGLQVLALTKNHAGSSLVDANQVLLLTGQLRLPGFGSASAALFNGTNFTPFVLTNTANNGPGTLSQLFVSNPTGFMMNNEHHMAVGFVILIALAISLALMFLLVVLGVVLERIRRKREGYEPLPQQRVMDKHSNVHRIPPATLLGGAVSEPRDSPPKI